MHLHSRQTLLLSPTASAAFEISKQLTNETCTSLVSLQETEQTSFSIVQEGLILLRARKMQISWFPGGHFLHTIPLTTMKCKTLHGPLLDQCMQTAPSRDGPWLQLQVFSIIWCVQREITAEHLHNQRMLSCCAATGQEHPFSLQSLLP